MSVVTQVKQALISVDEALAANHIPRALAILDLVMDQYPNSYLVYFKLGYIYIKERKLDQAIEALEKALTLQPGAADVILMLGSVYYGKCDYDKALHYYLLKADELKVSEVYRTIANIFHARNDYDLGEKYYRLAISLKPNVPEFILDLAQLLLGKIVYLIEIQESWVVEAHQLVDQVLSLQHHDHLGRAYKLKGDLFKMTDYPHQAELCYYESLKYSDQITGVHANLCTVLLAQGKFPEGMEQSQWRWKIEEYDYGNSFAPKDLKMPVWRGEQAPGKKLLIKPEQGIGDQIMLIQLIDQVTAMGLKVYFLAEPRLKSLIERSYPGINVIGSDKELTEQAYKEADYQLYLLDLLSILKFDPHTYRANLPFIKSDPPRTQYLLNKYQSLGPQLKVGIAWKSRSNTYGERKTIPLLQWQPILSVPGVQFICIQYGDVKQELADVNEKFNVNIYLDDEVDPINDLEAAVAQLDALDLIISVSSASAHLAGALGKPVWLLLSCAPLWHWLHEKSDSIWYPDISIYRQKYVWEWQSVIDPVAERLKAFALQHKGVEND